MRLIRTTDLTLHEFVGSTVPKYAILSHRWEEDELCLQDLERKKNKKKSGWKKVESFCRFALLKGFEYVWIDACSIDRTSSSELSEAINSMYKWYADARFCFAYLGDVHISDTTRLEDIQHPRSDELFALKPEDWHDQFQKSKWFTRGWTLQELVAPLHLAFIASDWQTVLGSKLNLSALVSKTTRIPEDEVRRFRPRSVGKDHKSIGAVSFAQVMSWASSRVTTRPEDLAYSLLGLLDVNMPLLYGEGAQKAFLRLQLEYLNRVDYETIFAWTMPRDAYYSGLLAPSPQCFADCGSLRIVTWDTQRPPFSMTNKGLRIEPLLRPVFYKGSRNDEYQIPLNCRSSATSDSPLAIHVVLDGDRIGQSTVAARYVGGHGIELVKFSHTACTTEMKRRVLFIPQDWD